MAEQNYEIGLKWTGNLGEGTKDYRSYERSYVVYADQKPDLLGSSDPDYMGDPSRWNPEELLIASLSACHMLWYLHLCSKHKIIVTEYLDRPTAIVTVSSSGYGVFEEAILHPHIKITDPSRIEEAKALHEEAHKRCFIANSLNFPVKVESNFSA